MAAHPTPRRLTEVEARLAERYVGVLDLVSRCAQAVERGDWLYVCDKATALEVAAGRLAEADGKAYAAWYADRGAVRAQVVRAAVAHQGRHCLAGRLLHPDQPLQPEPEGGGAR